MHDVVGVMTGAVVHDIEHQAQETGEHQAADAKDDEPGARRAE